MKRSTDKTLDKILKFYYPNFKEYTFQEKLDDNEFLIKSKRKKFVVKKYDQKTSRERIQFFQELQNLTNARMQIGPQVIRTKNGSCNVKVDGLYYGITEFVKGETLQREQIKDINKFFYEIGLFVGGLHKSLLEIENIGQKTMESLLYIPPESPKHLVALLKSYKEAQMEESWIEILKSKVDIASSYANDLEQFKKLPKRIVHGDIYMDNLLFDKSQKIVGLIDFVQAGVFFRCYEVIRALVQTNRFFQKTEINTQHFENYLIGYLQNNSLDEDEIWNMLDFYIYVQASDIAFLDIDTITNGGKENNEYARYRARSLKYLFKSRRLLNKIIYKVK